jgi:hypothetical protein
MFITKLTANKTRNRKNKIFAMLAAPAAIPPNPNKAAINAKTKKVSAQDNIIVSPLRIE